QVGGTHRSAEAFYSQIYVDQACSSNGAGVDVTISWTGSNPRAMSSYGDVSQHYNDWIPQSYASGGPLSPNITSYHWVGLAANSLFFVRINQPLGLGTWDVSATAVFLTGPGCGALASYSSPLPGSSSTYNTPSRRG